MQARIRGFIARRRYVTLRRAVVKLQSVCRMLLCRQKFLVHRRAVVVLQRKHRANLEARKQKLAYENMKLASVIIQKFWRLVLLNRLKQKSVICIQAHFRGYIQRRNYQAAIKQTSMLQRLGQSYLAHQKFLSMCKAAATLQIHWRAILTCRRQRKLFLHMKKSTVKIQRAYRNRLSMVKDRQNKAATVIQAWFRKMQKRNEFVRMRCAATVIQSRYRMVQNRRCYLAQKNSIIKIQSLWRGFCSRKELEKRRANEQALVS